MSTHISKASVRGRVARPTSRVYVWEMPVRLTHWVNVLAIVVLSFTGYYIGNPYIEVSPREPYSEFFMSNMRYLHIVFGYIMVASLLLRTYWAFFAGNHWASWRALVPFFTPEGRGYVLETLRYYFFLRREPPTVLGHNALAGFTYGIIVMLYFIQVFTGFALHSLGDPGGFWWMATSWIFGLVDPQHLRFIHHLIMWLLIGFAIHHVYSAFLVDAEESNGLMSSIFSGWKFIGLTPEASPEAVARAERHEYEYVKEEDKSEAEEADAGDTHTDESRQATDESDNRS